MNCKKCGSEVANDAKHCTNCGASLETKKSKARFGCLVLAVVLFLVGLIGIIVDSPKQSTTLPVSQQKPTPEVRKVDAPAVVTPRRSSDLNVCMELVKHSGEVGDFAITITGSLKNNCGKSFRYIQVIYKIYDSDGSTTGSALANMNNLGDGETWKFKAISTSRGTRFKLDQITGY